MEIALQYHASSREKKIPLHSMSLFFITYTLALMLTGACSNYVSMLRLSQNNHLPMDTVVTYEQLRGVDISIMISRNTNETYKAH